jgi:glycosyltransferase involved in cell wall biosynthesis
MACGTPVISSNTSSMPEIGGDAALYVTPENPQTIADAIVEILKNKELQAELVKKGLERAALFTWRHTAEGVYDCYQEVLK